MKLNKVFENNKEWIKSKLDADANYFEKLDRGQKPEFLFIGCSDSRVTAEELMGLGPGDVFVHRNIANMVIGTDLNAMSVVEYAVKHLQVKHVVVCGHYGCGGVKSAMQSADLGILNPWLRNIRDVYRLHNEELNKIENEDERYKRLIELNTQEQCVNLIKTAAIQKAIRDSGLKVHGWVFDIKTGELIDLKIDFEKILDNIREIYHLE
ncbi:carbonic anhydrase [Oceanihabitans sediminis]|uniref:Carbonic anhydrase n=1 Tax=Oceanihabitans sediminis TaxID=1812012 RepID=A0A368PB52_9FLAO|nr:carbonic anhydrase [Oceanihabitans sediminis]MDX1277288.1 carbonic anhydrase [Oceanihabitans sediminis]MDX1773102.1 carbonic anhydrase [Oceanihabitans sediminis]RBP34796.1 carbonic anhydrase [Oceanihabitans sediminis]RCU58441.1 carbonic anhydrase [Oceanihabitans sediminis]